MEGYTTTRIWEINGKMVVAATIEEAVATFHAYDAAAQIRTVTALCTGYDKDYDAIINERETT